MKPLPNKYDHKETESRWQKAWEENRVYAWDESQPRENTYVIDTPPPTVSGLLHMGHVFSYSQADFIARYQRMKGKTVFYPMGFDDNGLPTERLVEKVKKVRPTDMSREEFIKLCEGVSEEARKEFRKLFEEIALSVDWKQEYHTISEDSRKISQLSFLDLFNKDRAYRKLQPMLWDPVDQTAIAQAEVEDKEMPSQKNYIYFGLEGSDRKLEIMTTRPELLGACVAVIYNPNDERYQDLKGKQAITPVFGVKVPIIADEKVDMEKGTGLVMCCTFGDETDIAWWREHNLATRVMLNKYGKIQFLISELNGSIVEVNFLSAEDVGKSSLHSDNTVDIKKTISAFEKIQGLECRPHRPPYQEKKEGKPTARAKMLELLDEEGAIFKEPEITTHAEPCAERSGSPLEILPTNQWFVKILDQKEELKKKAEECNWYPAFMKVRIDQWIDGLSWDWCISRQRYFGVPFPVWYSKRSGEEGKILIASPDQLPVNPLVDLPEGYSRDEVEAEADVMDTWATSSVSPQLSSKGITDELGVDNARHKKLFPADLRPQAHEIIRTWAFYTIVKAHLHEDTIPWKNLMISGWCLASDKTKMSKSKGNVVTPVDLIEEKGSDVVRFWASTSRLGADTAYSEDVLKIGKKLVTKLWNATKFAAIHLDKLTQKPATAKADFEAGIINEPLDMWILTRLNKTIKRATQEFDKYEYCNARIAVEDFFWNDFCDNYLELVKTRVYGEAEGTTIEGQQSAVHTIYHCLDGILRLFAPIVPHITEELYAHIFDDKIEELGGSIHACSTWLNYEDYPVDETAEESGIACVSILDAVRKMKAERNVSIKWPLNFIAISNDDVKEKIKPLTEDLKNVTNSSEIIFGEQVTKDGQGQTIETSNGYKITAEFAKENSNAA
ncbi:MAG: valine--tRNA ligase [Alphaproteobacteria bacterium CG11_big_fil_rev_8_21_14_0_20_39_49]|nr:MAG: valine--tRNA ligase [Alphaproteobacteria bacterium CG11_big_fil_rev_8_21_14_0_20_39_49]